MCVCVSKRRPQYALTPSIPTGSLDILCVRSLEGGKKEIRKKGELTKKRMRKMSSLSVIQRHYMIYGS